MTIDELVRLLDLAAKGREEYAERIGETDNRSLIEAKADLLASARTYRQAIRLAQGDISILYGVLPSWRWDDVPLPALGTS